MALNQSQITQYTVSAAKATATPIEVHGVCLFAFDGAIQVMLERFVPATQEFSIVCAQAAGGPNVMIDFGNFGRTIWVYAGAPLAVSVWANTQGLN